MTDRSAFQHILRFVFRTELLVCALGLLLFGNSPVWGQNQAANWQESTASKLVSGVDARASYVQSSVGEVMGEEAHLSEIISLQISGATLEEALRSIAEKGDLELVYGSHPVLTEKRVTLNFQQVTVRDALRRATQGTDLKPMFSPSGQVVLVNEAAANDSPKMKARSADFPIKPTKIHAARKPIKIHAAGEASLRSRRQQGTIEGTVTDDESGEPIPGANVVIVGTQQGAATNAEGAYEITGVEAGSYDLRASFVGYAPQTVGDVEVAADETVTVDFSLQPSEIALDEVVAIGYGVQERRDLTGSITSVRAADLEGEAISSLEQGLQGKAAGLNVTTSSGSPGGEVIVRIRGNNSVLGSNDPLYVVDGMPVQSGTSGGASLLSTLNPGNIESVEVLKDASATAIYGSRGSNGVILITTKQGTRGRHMVNFESSLGLRQVEKKIEMMNSRQYVEIANERQTNDGNDPPFEDVGAYTQVNTDWQDKIFQPATMHNHSLTFSGGNEITRYSVTGNFFDEQGIIRGSDFLRGSIRVNLDQEISSRLSISTRSFLSRSTRDAVNESLVILSALQAPPFMTVYDEEGNYTTPTALKQFPFSPSSGENPVALAEEQLNRRIMDRVLANASADYNPLENLTIRVLLGVDHVNAEQNNYSPRFLEAGQPAGSGSKSTSTNSSFVNENTLTFDKNIRGNDRINVTAGVTWQLDRSKFLSGSASGFVTDELQNNILDAGEFFSAPNTGFSEATLLSGLGRVNYALDDRYLFTVSGRIDGSSRFGEGNKWGAFPSAAFSWVLSEEDFISQNFQQVSELKLRFSWGISGNQAISPYQSLQRFSDEGLAFGGTPTTGFAPENIGNPDLKWETTEEINAGLEIGMWENRLRVNADYYIKNTDDLLALVNLAPNTGFSTTLQNIGSTRNQGFELDVNADILRAELNWGFGFNVSANRNKVTATAGGQDIIAPSMNILGSANIVREGEPLGAFYGLETDGLTEDGFFNFVDQNDDGEINDEDRVILGDPYPDFTYGFTTHAAYGNFHLRASVQGEYGRQLWNNNRYRFMASFHRGPNQIADVAENRWTPDNPDPNAPYPRATSTLNQEPSDWYIEDASYLRLQNVQLTYNLPIESLNLSSLRTASIYVSGQNLLTLTGYSWYTPDVNSWGSGDLRIGIDQRSYPSARTVSLGVRVGL